MSDVTHAGFGVVDAPGKYANSELNGSECLILRRYSRCFEVLLLSGPSASREWQLLPEHIKPSAEPTS
jgi:hypothetical protein